MGLADIFSMIYPRLAFVALFLFILSDACMAEFMSVSYGIRNLEQQYSDQNTRAQVETNMIELNTQSYRLKTSGWFARGPSISAQHSQNHLDIDTHTPLYQFSLHQGLWFQFEWQQDTFDSQSKSAQIYLDENGNAQAINPQDNIILERYFQRAHVYWYESVKQEGPINRVGLFYSLETSPASAEISSTNASLFDGQFTGFGFSLGRIKDDKGLNFQWQLNIAQLDTHFSNNTTNHRALSSLESTVYQLHLELDWHYRYYLAPYWYLAPSIHYQYSTLLQTQLQPEVIEHEPLNFSQFSGFVSLRRYF